jgi:hypothetical protein
MYGMRHTVSGVYWTLVFETLPNLDNDALLCEPTCGDARMTAFQNRIARHDLEDGELLCVDTRRTEHNTHEITLGFSGQENRIQHVCVDTSFPSHPTVASLHPRRLCIVQLPLTLLMGAAATTTGRYVYMYDTQSSGRHGPRDE